MNNVSLLCKAGNLQLCSENKNHHNKYFSNNRRAIYNNLNTR